MAAEPGRPGRDGGAAHPDPRHPPGTGPARQAPTGSASHLAADRITGSAGDLISPRTSSRSLIDFPGITAMASGKQAGSGPARPHLQSMPFREPGARVRRRQSRQSLPSTRRSACTALTQPSPACSGTPGHLARAPLASYRRGSSSLARCRGGPDSRRRVLVVPGYLPQPRQSAHTDQSTSGCIDIRPMAPAHHPIRLARPAQPRHSHPRAHAVAVAGARRTGHLHATRSAFGTAATCAESAVWTSCRPGETKGSCTHRDVVTGARLKLTAAALACGVGSIGMTSDERWLAANWPFVRASLPAMPAG